MQLFSVGLIELHDDGSYELDALGNPIETYDTEDIAEFAKCWTGFDLRPMRSNLDVEGHSRGNRIDPMRIRGNSGDTKRDLFPKSNLYRGHLGDGYSLCADLPRRHFLSKGAKYTYLGREPGARLQPEAIHSNTKRTLHDLGVIRGGVGPHWLWTQQDDATVASLPRVRPAPESSPLYEQLCASHGAGMPCDFRSEILLPFTLLCDGDECDIDTVAVVDIHDSVANETVFYEYVRPACTEMTVFAPTTVQSSNVNQPSGLQMCADPTTEVAAIGCCEPGHSQAADGQADCRYMNEVASFARAVERCAARKDNYTVVCSERWSVPGCFGADGDGAVDERSWLRASETSACVIKVQVMRNGQVQLIHEGSTDQSLTQDSGNVFRVRWEGGLYPNVEDATCAEGCTAIGLESCVCETLVETTAAFTDMARLPSAASVESELFLGSAPPDAFADTVYTMCATSECDAARAAGVTVFLHSASSPEGGLDEHSIFHIRLNSTLGAWTRSGYFVNKRSIVRVAGGDYGFRNPPKFHSFIRPSVRDAEHEIEAVIDHLFWHKNVAPFIATRLIQRMTTSNPSPRYVRTVADAFRAGTYGGRSFLGVYGDLGATFAASMPTGTRTRATAAGLRADCMPLTPLTSDSFESRCEQSPSRSRGA